MKNPKCKDSKLIHNGHILDFYENTMEFQNGNTAVWDIVKHKGAAAVVAVDDDGKIFMVKQYRPGCDRVTLEIPAGCLNEGEDRMTAAARELEEEIGYKADEIELLTKFYSAPAFSTEYIEIYVAKGLKKTKQHLDPDEELEVEKYDLNELINKIMEFEIMDSKTIAGIMCYKESIARKIMMKYRG